MNNNKLIIAAAGSGKTTFLVKKSLEIEDEPILITTYTEFNAREIRNKFIKRKGCMPRNVTIQTWFSFLLQHGVRPYQSVLNESLHNTNVGFYLTNEKSGKRFIAPGKPMLSGGRPVYWGQADFLKCYFTASGKIYSDKISKFVCDANSTTDGEVVERISRIFRHIYIDEIQDLAGYDLDIIKQLFKSKSNIILVGDPRQVTYLTHQSPKYKKYASGQIKLFVENGLGKKIQCNVDETTLSASHRNNQLICDYSAKLYPQLSTPMACSCPTCHTENDHTGVFVIKPSDVERYHAKYTDVTQLRWNSASNVNRNYKTINMGASKGSTFNRALIYPTKGMEAWIKDNSCKLGDNARAKLYVALTRSRLSSTIVLDFQDDDTFPDVQKYSFSNCE